MSRLFISYLFIFSLLFMGIESAVDAAGGAHPHAGEYALSLGIDDPTSLEAHDDEGHCSHCCHGHAGSIAGNITTLNCDIADQRIAFYQPLFLNFSEAPPTPPPIV